MSSNPDKIKADLIKLNKAMEDATASSNQLKGQMDQLQKRLKEEFDCATIEDAEALLKKKEKEVIRLEKEIKTGVEELEDLHANNN